MTFLPIKNHCVVQITSTIRCYLPPFTNKMHQRIRDISQCLTNRKYIGYTLGEVNLSFHLLACAIDRSRIKDRSCMTDYNFIKVKHLDLLKEYFLHYTAI